MIFLGPMYQPEKEKELLQQTSGSLSNASNQYQVDLLQGLSSNERDLKIINVLPVGTWPKHYSGLLLRNRQWKFRNYDGIEIGCINLPVLKQWMRTISIKKKLKQLVKTDEEIIIYSTYLPFLSAIQKLPANVKTTLIVTDLPEYYDLGRTSYIKKILRKINNRFIYKKLSRIDRYVLLTEAMKNRLPVGNKPYTIVEGIWSSQQNDTKRNERSNDKKIIFYAGTLHKQFGILTLLDAFRMLKEDAELWICGSGDCTETIKVAAAADQRIKFFGYVNSASVQEYRNQATVLVNPRPNEGEYTKYSFPSKTMGYMASGKPVVMNRLDGIPHEYDSYLIYAADSSVHALAEALTRVLAMSDSERSEFGNRAKEFILTQKNSKEQAKKIIEMIDDR